MDVICQAKSGMGKTAVFVIATLQQLEPMDCQVSVLVMCHARYNDRSTFNDQCLIVIPLPLGNWPIKFTRSMKGSPSILMGSKSLSFLVGLASRQMRRHFVPTVPTLSWGHLDGSWLWWDRSLSTFEMSSILFWMSVTKCLNNLVRGQHVCYNIYSLF